MARIAGLLVVVTGFAALVTVVVLGLMHLFKF
jgi:hypothetical protein